jgi:hypothetical protein
MREWLRDVREGFRIMRSRRFWRSFRDYWSTGSISARMDAWTSRVRENTGLGCGKAHRQAPRGKATGLRGALIRMVAKPERAEGADRDRTGNASEDWTRGTWRRTSKSYREQASDDQGDGMGV